MSQEHNKHYCLLTDQIGKTVDLWAASYCLLTDQSLSYVRPAMLREPNTFMACSWVVALANLYITILITEQIVGNFKEMVL